MSATHTDDTTAAPFDVLIVGGGPAGLSAALNLARARMTVLLVDATRPRNAATLRSHGFLTRDGATPVELRKQGRQELAAYPQVRIVDRAVVRSVRRDGAHFAAEIDARGHIERVSAGVVLVAAGLQETLPDIPDIRSYYGMSLYSCIVCDSYELSDRPLALLGDTDDLPAHARLLSRWTNELTVFTLGAPIIDSAEEDDLRTRGIRVERDPVAGLEGERGALAAVLLADGARIPVGGGFVRPHLHAPVAFVEGVDLDRDPEGWIATDGLARTSASGVYAAGDIATPGPQQLIVAAGQGALAAGSIIRDAAARGA